MMLKIQYMSGAGNLFSVFDNRKDKLQFDYLQKIAVEVCNNFKIKTDGFLVLSDSTVPAIDFEVHFFNPDASYGAMCGNGGRCAVKYAVDNDFNIKNKTIQFKMANKIYFAEIIYDYIKLQFEPPKKIEYNVLLSDISVKGHYVDVNSDHFVINFKDIEVFTGDELVRINLKDFAVPVRYHEQFQPKGVNVDLFDIRNQNEVYLRTYERGVENETAACGTGAVSTALIAHFIYGIELPVKIIPKSKKCLFVDLNFNVQNEISAIFLSGPAEYMNYEIIDINK